MSRPPTDASLEQALAYGIDANRAPTAAHPHCRCGKPYTPTCRTCQAKPNEACKQIWDQFPRDEHGHHLGRVTRPATVRDCPMHRPKNSAPAGAVTPGEGLDRSPLTKETDL